MKFGAAMHMLRTDVMMHFGGKSLPLKSRIPFTPTLIRHVALCPVSFGSFSTTCTHATASVARAHSDKFWATECRNTPWLK